jgi:glycine/D-amino acid oxidase-like deaminating enzyme/nitrite reductase/ring-hydroxylating ferredoxin subunit
MNAAQRSIHQSVWVRTNPLKQRFDSLSGTHTTEVLVLGAGLSGLSVALELLGRGHQVAICEANVIGAGTTGGSSGHLDAHPEMGPQQLIDQLGEDAARRCVRWRLDAIDAIEQRAAEQCDFVRVPAYFYSEDSDAEDKLNKEYAAAARLGLDVSASVRVPLPHAKTGYRLQNMARIDCMAYLRRLTELVVAAGGTIFENTVASGPTEKSPTSLAAGKGKFNFKHVVCAVHCNYTAAFRIYFQTPAYQSYVMAVRTKHELEDALYWDDQSPYFYTRRMSSRDANAILVGGCDHRTGSGHEAEALGKLEAYIRERFDVVEVISAWSAELFEPSDGLPMIGKVPNKENVWIVTGLSGVGLTWGTAAGKLIADQIDGRDIPLQGELSPGRFGISGTPTTVVEQAKSVANYAERVLPAENLDDRHFAPGEGAVGKLNGEHVAICRDRDGCEYRHSPLCTHMGGVVHWNEVEQTWDCPVHGGRFAADGVRLYGPPEDRLTVPGGNAPD